MRGITINIPILQRRAMGLLQAMGLYTSRSEIIRAAVHGYLHDIYIDSGIIENDDIEKSEQSITSVAMSDIMINHVDALVNDRVFWSRSAVIRAAIRRFLDSEMELIGIMLRKQKLPKSTEEVLLFKKLRREYPNGVEIS